jgi:hypothetical protein
MTPMPFTLAQVSPPEASPSRLAPRARGETKSLRASALDLKTAPTRETPDDLA